MINKQKLDAILISNKAQPVGNGYVDVIVKQENDQRLVEEIINNGFQIDRISWWEYIDSDTKKARHGIGGPKSQYYDGWFSEINIEDDHLSVNTVKDIMKIIEE